MIGKLFQDGICQLDGLFVLLVLVVLDDILEEIRFLFGQGLTSSALGIGLGVVVGRHGDEMIGGDSSVSVRVDRRIYQSSGLRNYWVGIGRSASGASSVPLSPAHNGTAAGKFWESVCLVTSGWLVRRI